jgi:hypothetical protein
MTKKKEIVKLKRTETENFTVETNQSKITLKLSEDDSKSSNGSIIEERANWGNRIEFLLACIGYSVGLGNVW